MDKMRQRALMLVLVVCMLALPELSARAQAALEPTQIVVGGPAQADLGKLVTVQAVLADSQGHPISGALITFSSPATFMSVTRDVVLAQVVTNAKGQAVARFTNNFSGDITLKAEFAGDGQYAASSATTQITNSGDSQVYSDNFSGQTTGGNVMATASGALPAPALSQWVLALRRSAGGIPVAFALLLVWSMYLVAVGYIFRIAALAKEPQPGSTPATPDPGRPS